MHYRYLVTFKKEEAKNSKEARDFVYNYLVDNNFANQGGRWSGSPADWFVIGGRWSGELLLLTKEFGKIVDKAKKSKEKKGENTHFVSTGWVEENKKLLQELWEKMGGKDINLYNRDQYEEDGYEDDAMIITDEIYKKLLRQYEKLDTESDGHCDIDYDLMKKKDMVGKKWVVVVDYHN